MKVAAHTVPRAKLESLFAAARAPAGTQLKSRVLRRKLAARHTQTGVPNA